TTLSRKNVGETWRFLFNIGAVIVVSCQEPHLKKKYTAQNELAGLHNWCTPRSL
ncbi:hypothetical protein BS47DRAFT_1337454, partial [Hydnum rufescens UP504]